MRSDKTTASGKSTDRSMRNHALAGLVVVFGLLGGLAAWSATAEISGAVIAPGRIAVDSKAKKVQHPEGGVIAALHVQEGAHVRAGELVVVLDDTVLSANLAIVSKALDDLAAQEARLLAERDGKDAVDFPAALIERAKANADALDSIEGQRIIFESRRRERETARTQVTEQIAQLESLIEGITAQRAAREQELKLIGEELKGVRALYAKELVPLTRVISLDRDRTRIEGESSKLFSDLATTREYISEKKILMAHTDQEFHSQVVKEIADVRNKVNENVERRIAAEDRLSRIDIRAPVSGTVHELAVFTVGGVLGAGEVAMLIVPQDDTLVVDAEIAPDAIEELHVGQPAVVRFSAFSDPDLKDATGTIAMIAPDLIADPRTGRAFYRIKLSVDAPAGSDGQPLKLLPGMPVETFIAKGDRTVLAYLLEPVKDQMRHVFRE